MSRPRKRRLLKRVVVSVACAALLYSGACVAMLLLLRYADPPFTMVQVQRRVEALVHRRDYKKQYTFVPLRRISTDLQHAVIAAEDGRFYEHRGIDFQEMEIVVKEELLRGRVRGASTITQQLVKNLFMTTHRNPLRKPFEFVFAPVAELILPKSRILELYLNVIEWGPGIYGAEAAARTYYHVPAARLGRDESARMAACIPLPRRWRPQQMDKYSRIILARMEGRGW